MTNHSRKTPKIDREKLQAEIRRLEPEIIADMLDDAIDLLCRRGWLVAGSRKLGRKHILDTQLAATYYSAGVNTIVTSNKSDFTIF